MINFKRLSKKRANVKRFTGLGYDKFMDLVTKITPLWQESEQERLQRKNRKRAIGGGRKYKLETIEDKLLLFLTYYRVYVCYEFLAQLFEIDASNISRLIKKMTPLIEFAADPSLKTALKKVRDESTKINSMEEFTKKYPDMVKVIFDATEQRIQRPKKDNQTRKKYRSGKKKAFTIKTQIIINKKHKIINVSDSFAGSVHDKKIFDLSNTQNKIPKQSVGMGDLGYLGTNTENLNLKIILPVKKQKGQKKLLSRDSMFNKKLAQSRVPVEHVFAKIKKFKICGEIYRGLKQNYNQTFRNIAALVNFGMVT